MPASVPLQTSRAALAIADGSMTTLANLIQRY